MADAAGPSFGRPANGPISRPITAATTARPTVIHGPDVLDNESRSSTTTAGSQRRSTMSPILAAIDTPVAGTRPLRTWRARMNPARKPPHAPSATTVTERRNTCTSGNRPIINRRRLTLMMSQRPVTKTNDSVL
jgi:hypothetical protein